MKKPIISIIAAVGENRELGKDNKLLWHIPEDFKRFKKITFGHPVIMGRKTFQSLGKPLTGRTNIVITNDKNFSANDCLIVHSLDNAIKLARQYDDQEIFIIGGGQIYHQAIKLADKLYLTVIKGKFTADTYFPDYSRFNQIVFRQTGKYKNYDYEFLELIPGIK